MKFFKIPFNFTFHKNKFSCRRLVFPYENITYTFKKFYVSDRKKMTKVGNKFKNSNTTIINKFLSISTRYGNKRTLFVKLQKFYCNYLFGFFFSNDENIKKLKFFKDSCDLNIDLNLENYGFNEFFFKKFSYFNLIQKLITDDASYANLNKLVGFILPLYNTLFTIKVKKLDKKMKAKYKKKYLYKLSYVYPKNRVNLTLKFMNYQSLQIKNYYLHERYMKMFSATILAPHDSLAWRQRIHAYTNVIKKYKNN